MKHKVKLKPKNTIHGKHYQILFYRNKSYKGVIYTPNDYTPDHSRYTRERKVDIINEEGKTNVFDLYEMKQLFNIEDESK